MVCLANLNLKLIFHGRHYYVRVAGHYYIIYH